MGGPGTVEDRWGIRADRALMTNVASVPEPRYFCDIQPMLEPQAGAQAGMSVAFGFLDPVFSYAPGNEVAIGVPFESIGGIDRVGKVIVLQDVPQVSQDPGSGP